jgi:hypothetical protein
MCWPHIGLSIPFPLLFLFSSRAVILGQVLDSHFSTGLSRDAWVILPARGVAHRSQVELDEHKMEIINDYEKP